MGRSGSSWSPLPPRGPQPRPPPWDLLRAIAWTIIVVVLIAAAMH